MKKYHCHTHEIDFDLPSLEWIGSPLLCPSAEEESAGGCDIHNRGCECPRCQEEV